MLLIYPTRTVEVRVRCPWRFSRSSIALTAANPLI